MRKAVSCAARARVVACDLAVDRSGDARALQEALNDARSRCGDDLPDTVAQVWPEHVPESVLVQALDHARNEGAGNSGLGLAIARDIARSHGGDVALDTSTMGGLRAIIRVPL